MPKYTTLDQLMMLAQRTRTEIGKASIKGDPGDTPYIGANGNWWVGNADTGVRAGGNMETMSITDIIKIMDGSQ